MLFDAWHIHHSMEKGISSFFASSVLMLQLNCNAAVELKIIQMNNVLEEIGQKMFICLFYTLSVCDSSENFVIIMNMTMILLLYIHV